MRDSIELKYLVRRRLRRVKRGGLAYLSTSLTASGAVPSRLRLTLLRRLGVEVDPTARVAKGVRFENRNVRLGAGTTIGEGVRFEGVGPIDVVAGAVVPSGHVLSTRVPTKLEGLFVDRPVLWTES